LNETIPKQVPTEKILLFSVASASQAQKATHLKLYFSIPLLVIFPQIWLTFQHPSCIILSLCPHFFNSCLDDPKKFLNWEWWDMPMTPGLRQENHECQVSLRYIANAKPAQAT
jgi:hypothetical protein